MDVVAALTRWIHILCAAVIVGGVIATRFVTVPSAQALGEEAARRFRREAIRRTKRLMHTAIGIVILSGIANYAIAVRHEPPPAYHMLLGMKIVLALILVTLVILLTMGHAEDSVFVRRERTVLGVSIVLGLVVILLASAAGALR